jgi:hypothetical protein
MGPGSVAPAINPRTLKFNIRSTFTNNRQHTSANIEVNVICKGLGSSNGYTIVDTNAASIENP